MKDALEKAAGLVNSAGSLLPSNPENADVRSIREDLKNPPIPVFFFFFFLFPVLLSQKKKKKNQANDDPITQKNNVQQLDDWGQQNGVIPDEEVSDLAAAVDRAGLISYFILFSGNFINQLIFDFFFSFLKKN